MPKRKLSAYEGSGQTVVMKLADVPENRAESCFDPCKLPKLPEMRTHVMQISWRCP
jgi:hypothetical protein